jgi:putative transposase
MARYSQILYQVVFSTKHRQATLLKANRIDLYKYIWGILKEKNCFLYQMGGIEDHIHIVFSLHPSVALADLIRDIKISSSSFIKEKGFFPDFGGWQEGYGAFTYSIDAKEALIEYVKNQEEHHKTIDSKEEFRNMLKEFGVDFDEKYFE